MKLFFFGGRYSLSLPMSSATCCSSSKARCLSRATSSSSIISAIFFDFPWWSLCNNNRPEIYSNCYGVSNYIKSKDIKQYMISSQLIKVQRKLSYIYFYSFTVWFGRVVEDLLFLWLIFSVNLEFFTSDWASRSQYYTSPLIKKIL